VGVSAILVTLVFVIAIVISGSGGPALSDSTSCWDWSSASQGQQDDYARMYISEYGELANSDGDPVGTVENAITVGCTTAFNFGEGQVVMSRPVEKCPTHAG
jgi:hypothetical protein